ncbi:hypothetical protein GCM10007875_21690 [Limnobacter litoralis]|uniref:Uncharacterized protein n=1 Tax=Limnobacter litoralis TaxID=481366 RepID=A0ABQ5YR29_9BURK|nr:hypothetical protein GCM10007875_21690 [Limnobacter litoralis]
MLCASGCASVDSLPKEPLVDSGAIAVVFDAGNSLQLKKVGVTQISYQDRLANISKWGLKALLDNYAQDTLKGAHRFSSVSAFDSYNPTSVFQRAAILNKKIDYVLVFRPASKASIDFGTLSALHGIGITQTSTLTGKHKTIGQVILRATLYDAKNGKVMLSKEAHDWWLPQFELNDSLKLDQEQINSIYNNTIPVGKSVVHQLLRQLQLIP